MSFTFNPKNPKANQTVTFDASSSYDPDGNLVSYIWDFGDGNVTIMTNAIVTHAFTSNGLYNVNLTVFDNDGLSSSFAVDISIGGIPPYVSFTYAPSEPYRDETVTFNASTSFDSDGDIISYVWNFGDGTNQTTSNPILTHVFAQNGVYNVNLTVFDDDGLHSSIAQYICVGRRPVAEFTFSPENPGLEEGINFNASLSYDLDGLIVYVIWDFGDLNVIRINITDPTDFIITHTYRIQAGIYQVTLTVFDSDGLNTSIIHDVNVIPEFPPTAILPLLIVLNMLAIVLSKKKLRKAKV